MNIVFQNLEPSELARDITRERLSPLWEKFPILARHRASITLSRENSPVQAGPDQFTASIILLGPGLGTLRLAKRAPNLYQALSLLYDRIQELLSRRLERSKSSGKRRARHWKRTQRHQPDSKSSEWDEITHLPTSSPAARFGS